MPSNIKPVSEEIATWVLLQWMILRERGLAQMVEVVTFQRLYHDGQGIEHKATPQYVANVIRSMNEHADGWDPFRVRLRMSDGATVTVGPKRKRT